jgi:non-ribosomal peptide synthetase component F
MPKRKPKDTRYTNTDFDLKSHLPFEFLRDELAASCTLLHYTLGDDGNWHAIVESSYPDDDHGDNRTASMDIRLILNALARLSDQARSELNNCYMREFNLGFDCWDTWSYLHSLPCDVVRDIADLSCTLAVTLYPMRDPDGKPKE